MKRGVNLEIGLGNLVPKAGQGKDIRLLRNQRIDTDDKWSQFHAEV